MRTMGDWVAVIFVPCLVAGWGLYKLFEANKEANENMRNQGKADKHLREERAKPLH